MNKIFPCAFLLLISFSAFAQKNMGEELGFYLFDANGKSVGNNMNVAATFWVETKMNDTTFVVRNYKNGGPMIWQQSFFDEGMNIPEGRFVWYDNDGNIDSTGLVVDGHKDGEWINYKHELAKDGSVKNIVTSRTYYNVGKKITEAEFYNASRFIIRNSIKKGQPISETEFNSDTTGTRIAEFSKGSTGWSNYVSGHLDPKICWLIPQYKLLKYNQAPVMLSFIVGIDGSIDDVFIMNSCGYPFDKEAMRVIRQSSGKWNPAQWQGKSVTYRVLQGITFQVYNQ